MKVFWKCWHKPAGCCVVVSDETQDTRVPRPSFATGFQCHPPLQDTGMLGWEHSQIPSTSKAEAVCWFRRQRGAGCPCSHNGRVPWQPAGPGFHLTPQNVVGRKPSPLTLTPGHRRGTCEWHLAEKPHRAAGTWVGSPHTSTTSLTCCSDY